MLIKAGQSFACLEVLLGDPPAPGDFRQGGRGHLPWRVAAVEGEFPAVVVAADQLISTACAGPGGHLGGSGRG